MADAIVRPDARKTLTQVAREWSACIKCSLGTQRIEREGAFVFGRGLGGGVMFIGEGPGVEEEKMGEPFVGKSGQLLHRVLATLKLDEYYLTNLVSCRSCVPQTDADGTLVFRKNYRTGQPEQAYRDEPPTPPQYNACMPRLQEEIYLVDPIVIVGLGNKACEALMGHPITITRDRGEPTQIEISGASFSPILTEKKQEWLHRMKDGTMKTLSEPNTVRYYFMPTFHPAYVIRKLADQGPDSPFRQFVTDIKKAIKTHEVYREMVFGIVPTSDPTINDEEMHQQLQAEEQSDD